MKQRLAMRDRKLVAIIGAAATALCLGCSSYRLYWGDVHGHTELSDGRGSVADFLSYARDQAKLDFVIVTDHDFGTGPSWRMSPEAWQQIQDEVEKHTHEGRFVAIAGYEWTSQAKYWRDYTPAEQSQRLFDGPPQDYNHKNVYFPSRVPHIFSAKDAAYCTPDLLAAAVLASGGLIQNNHPSAGPEGRDQWAYDPRYSCVITNTEIGPDTPTYNGKQYTLNTEQTIREFLNRGGKTGFVAGSDTHEGHPAARTAVLARKLTRAAIFDALRHRCNYAVSGARIGLDFRINGHLMGEEIEIRAQPRLKVVVEGTDRIAEIAIIRDGQPLYTIRPGTRMAALDYVDRTFERASYYYVRITQADADEQGNPSRAWSSPIWVKRI
jgi:hypothetical protein